ncbi:MAG: hypothetical protein WC076_02505 [Terrimicrobiaceae bacterium]
MDAINRGVSEAIKENPAASYFEMNDLVFDEKGGPVWTCLGKPSSISTRQGMPPSPRPSAP